VWIWRGVDGLIGGADGFRCALPILRPTGHGFRVMRTRSLERCDAQRVVDLADDLRGEPGFVGELAQIVALVCGKLRQHGEFRDLPVG
jgi:hypothetical protein